VILNALLTKAVAIIELVLNPPTDGPLFCVDEKPGIGVRRPTAPDQPPAPRRPPAVGRPAARGRPARREFEYVRTGTVDLLAGFRVNDGQVYGLVRLQHRSREFCELLALLDEQTPVGKPIHLILDPVSWHWSAEVAKWLATHPQRRFVFHFLPVHASWLSFIEVWFSILSRKCLKRADFADATIATQQIEGFITTYNTHLAHPFTWKRGVRFYNRLKAKIAARPELQQQAA
jgi:transposase